MKTTEIYFEYLLSGFIGCISIIYSCLILSYAIDYEFLPFMNTVYSNFNGIAEAIIFALLLYIIGVLFDTFSKSYSGRLVDSRLMLLNVYFDDINISDDEFENVVKMKRDDRSKILSSKNNAIINEFHRKRHITYVLQGLLSTFLLNYAILIGTILYLDFGIIPCIACFTVFFIIEEISSLALHKNNHFKNSL